MGTPDELGERMSRQPENTKFSDLLAPEPNKLIKLSFSEYVYTTLFKLTTHLLWRSYVHVLTFFVISATRLTDTSTVCGLAVATRLFATPACRFIRLSIWQRTLVASPAVETQALISVRSVLLYNYKQTFNRSILQHIFCHLLSINYNSDHI